MVVEPASLCWLTGRMVQARDGVTWAEEFARYPALKAVVRDDGSGLGKGLKLERARRRAAGQSDIDDTLDIFHTLREGGRALRTTWGGATRALEAADAGQRGVDRLGRQGTSRTGKVKKINRLWREAEQLWDQATAAETAWRRGEIGVRVLHARGSPQRSQAGRGGRGGGAAPPERCGVGQDAAAVTASRKLHVPGSSPRALDRSGLGPRRLVRVARPGRVAAPALATLGHNARFGRHTGVDAGPDGPVGEDGS